VRTDQKADDGKSRAVAEGAGRIPVGAADSAEGCLCARNNSDPQQQRLLEKVVETGNMKRAWKQVKRNKGSYGIDGRTIADTETFLKTDWPAIRQKILDETFKPYPVKRVEILKPGGGIRKLGVPTVVDRMIQQAICQVLNPVFDPTFSEFSYGFRPNRSAHDAVRQAREFQRNGKQWVVDLDLRQFFDEVNHDILMARVGRKVKDKRLKRLINAYLKSGVMLSDGYVAIEKGTPQGGPLSPLLSNILLDDLDKELEKRGHSFCRYADDCNIYVSSRKAGERVMKSITEYLEKLLKLKVNKEKSAVERPWKRKFLGFSSQKVFGKIRTSVPETIIKRFRMRMNELFHEGRARNVARFIKERMNPVLRGWLQYFSVGTSRNQLQTLDFWIRRKLRCIIWRQWKTPRTRMRKLRSLGISKSNSMVAYNRRGPWRNAGIPQVKQALTPAYFQNLELYLLTDNFKKLRTTLT